MALRSPVARLPCRTCTHAATEKPENDTRAAGTTKDDVVDLPLPYRGCVNKERLSRRRPRDLIGVLDRLAVGHFSLVARVLVVSAVMEQIIQLISE